MKLGIKEKAIQLALAYLQLDQQLDVIYVEKINLLKPKDVLKREYFENFTDVNS